MPSGMLFLSITSLIMCLMVETNAARKLTFSSCTNKWDDKCFLVSGRNMPLYRHRQYCEEMEFTLVSVHSFEENRYIRSLVLPQYNILTGAIKPIGHEPGEFYWLDGSEYNFETWLVSPMQGIDKESYIFISTSGHWFDSQLSSYSQPVICQRTKQSFLKSEIDANRTRELEEAAKRNASRRALNGNGPSNSNRDGRRSGSGANVPVTDQVAQLQHDMQVIFQKVNYLIENVESIIDKKFKDVEEKLFQKIITQVNELIEKKIDKKIDEVLAKLEESNKLFQRRLLQEVNSKLDSKLQKFEKKFEEKIFNYTNKIFNKLESRLSAIEKCVDC